MDALYIYRLEIMILLCVKAKSLLCYWGESVGKGGFGDGGFGWLRGGFGDALYIYRFESMIVVHVKAKSLLCYWAVRDLGIGMAQIARRLN